MKQSENMVRIVICACIVWLLSGSAFAAVPQTMNYQGYLTNQSGVPLNAPVSVTFALYDVATGGTALWTETQGSVTVSNGIFNVVLGNGTPMTIPFDAQYWLGVKVGGDAEMTPRRQLTSVGYAFRASVADSVNNTASIIPAGTVVAFAGTTAPAGWLLCDGTSYLRATYATLFTAIGNAHGAADVSHFNVPDYRGRFLRGLDGIAGNDPDKAARTAMNSGGNTGNAVGSVQGSMYGSHSHGVLGYDYNDGNSTSPSHLKLENGDLAYYGFTLQNPTSGGVQANGGNETRPVNASVNWIIKY